MIHTSKLQFSSFTLIELLIVIVVIGILANSLIPRITGMQDKAKHTRVDKDFQTFREVVFLAQTTANKTLTQITGKGCSACCAGYPYTSGSIVKSDPICMTRWIDNLRKIEQAAGMQVGELASLETDPRGNPYLLDENEGESGGCGKDTLHTAGKDGNAFGIIVGNSSYTTGDNRGINIVPYNCPGSY